MCLNRLALCTYIFLQDVLVRLDGVSTVESGVFGRFCARVGMAMRGPIVSWILVLSGLVSWILVLRGLVAWI